jgi:hypothetical protein
MRMQLKKFNYRQIFLYEIDSKLSWFLHQVFLWILSRDIILKHFEYTSWDHRECLCMSILHHLQKHSIFEYEGEFHNHHVVAMFVYVFAYDNYIIQNVLYFFLLSRMLVIFFSHEFLHVIFIAFEGKEDLCLWYISRDFLIISRFSRYFGSYFCIEVVVRYYRRIRNFWYR